MGNGGSRTSREIRARVSAAVFAAAIIFSFSWSAPAYAQAAPPVISKFFSADNVALNGTVFLFFTIVNPNGSPLTGIAFTDVLPSGLIVASPNNLSSDCGGTVTAPASSPSITLAGGTLGPGAFCTISLSIEGIAAGPQANTTGTITSTESGPGATSNTATETVVVPPDLAKAFGAASIPFGGTTSLTFTLTNPNTTVGLSNIAFNDTLPSGLVVASPNGLTGSCLAAAGAVLSPASVTANPGSNNIDMSALSLDISGSCSFSVDVSGVLAGTQVNTTGNVTATFDDGTGTSVGITGNTATASLIVLPPPPADMSITKSASAPLPFGGQNITYTIPVSNGGPGVATAVTVTDVLPPGTTFVSATPPGICSGTSTITCSVGTLNSGATTTITLVVTAPVAGGSLINTATVTAFEPDPNPANNSATTTTTISPASAIPALSDWMLVLLAAALASVALRKMM